MSRIFKRKIYDKMVEWKQRRQGSTALLIKGARRIGKSTVCRAFAEAEYESYILIDFLNPPAGVKELFEDLSDLNYFFLRLSTLYHVKLHERRSVIVFDEVQMFPQARQAIKYLVADGRYDYIETGSLLSIRKNIQSIVIPSEETRLSMYPLDFEEFLEAVGEEMKWDLIRYSFENLKPLGDALHRAIMRLFRLYMAIGGMPQAVNAYLDSNDMMTVDEVKREILELYLEDLRKIDPSGKASLLFSSVPSQLGEGSGGRYKIGSVLPNMRPSEASELITDLADSMTVNVSYRASDPTVGLAIHKDPTDFRIFLGDTGLLVTLAFLDGSVTDNILYNKLLSDKLSVDLGYIYENVVAQLLLASGHSLYYYTFRNDGARHPYEIDFLTIRQTKLIPIEVKSSSYMAHKSLDEFLSRYPSRIGVSYLLSPKDIRRDGPVLGLPVYMTPLL